MVNWSENAHFAVWQHDQLHSSPAVVKDGHDVKSIRMFLKCYEVNRQSNRKNTWANNAGFHWDHSSLRYEGLIFPLSL